MKATAESIWEAPAYLPYLQPRLTDEVIEQAERQLGFTLPEELLNLLQRQNGGYIRFSLPDSVHSVIAGIGPHFPSLLDFDWDEAQEHVSFSLHGLVPFDGDGHWHLCLDFRRNSHCPTITHIDVECNSQETVAASFSEYLEKLILNVPDDFVIEGIEAASLARKLAETFGIEIGSPDNFAYGYPVHRLELGTKNRPEWLWISPNRVSRGFVRGDDRRFEELKDALPGFTSRFPELSDFSLIVSMTDGVRPQVIQALEQLHVQVRRIRGLMEIG